MTGESSSPSLLLHTTTGFVACLLLVLRVGLRADEDTGCVGFDTVREGRLAPGDKGRVALVGNFLVEDPRRLVEGDVD